MLTSTVQFEPVPMDPIANLATIRTYAGQAAAQGSVLVVFPEMCLPGYWHLRRRTPAQLHEMSETTGGPLLGSVRALSDELGIGVGVGFLEREGDALFNSYAVCLPDGAIHVHRKLHAFENAAISSGDSYTVFDTPWAVRVGILICWDNNLVENARITALHGAQLLIAPHMTGGTNSPSPYGMKPIPVGTWRNRDTDPDAIRAQILGPNGRAWLLRWLPSRAHDNGMFIAFSNGIGEDDGEIRTGNSMLIDPYGRIITETNAAGPDMVTSDLDLGLIPMSTGRRWIAGRRPELYAPLTVTTGTERQPREARFSTQPPRTTVS
jgi:predicted amidohydrolase